MGKTADFIIIALFLHFLIDTVQITIQFHYDVIQGVICQFDVLYVPVFILLKPLLY